MKVFAHYGYVSKLKIKYKKIGGIEFVSHLSYIGRSSEKLFLHLDKTLKYMEVWITTTLNALYKNNCIPVIRISKEDFEKWSLKYFFWFGRTVIVKMTILPQITFFLNPTNFLTLNFFYSVGE